MTGSSVPVNQQVRALLGDGVDLRFCVVRPDFVAHAFEEAHEVALVLAGALLAGDRQLGVDALDVLERRGLQVENGRILARVGDLQDPLTDHERLVALATEIAGLPLEIEIAETHSGILGQRLRRECRPRQEKLPRPDRAADPAPRNVVVAHH